MKRMCLSCAAAWGLMLGLALDFSGVDRLLAGESGWSLPLALLSIGLLVSCAAGAGIAALILLPKER